MRKKRFLILLSFILVLLVAGAALAQSMDQMLEMNDNYIMQRFTMFPRDYRYDTSMDQISRKLNSHIVQTFGDDKQITFCVCPSMLGFNAMSFHRFIVFDSLLMDSLRYLSAARIYYGNVDNEYVDRLSNRVLLVHKAHMAGNISGNYSNVTNPFGLPELPGPLSEQQKKQAKHLFSEMLASWMAHEGSHCMRNHMKYRLQSLQDQQHRFRNSSDPMQFAQVMDVYANAQLSQELEKDADVYASRWLKNSKIGVEGYVTWLKFGEKLEKLMGTDNAYLRTHPKCSTRIRYVTNTYRGK